MDEQTEEALETIAQEPGGLDGHTIDELADYLDAGRTPPDPSIESSPACRHALAALERLRRMAPELLVDDDGAGDEDDWVTRVMDGIALDAHAGADFVLTDGGPDAHVVMTEGALRALIRGAGDDQPGFLVGRIRFDGEPGRDGLPFGVLISVTVMHGMRIPHAVELLRAQIAAALQRHTELGPARIDIGVDDLETPDGAA